jgi:hypothetical protein
MSTLTPPSTKEFFPESRKTLRVHIKGELRFYQGFFRFGKNEFQVYGWHAIHFSNNSEYRSSLIQLLQYWERSMIQEENKLGLCMLLLRIENSKVLDSILLILDSAGNEVQKIILLI